MPVVITDFEAVAEPAAPASPAEPEPGGRDRKAGIDPCDIEPALQALAQRALRCWAH